MYRLLQLFSKVRARSRCGYAAGVHLKGGIFLSTPAIARAASTLLWRLLCVIRRTPSPLVVNCCPKRTNGLRPLSGWALHGTREPGGTGQPAASNISLAAGFSAPKRGAAGLLHCFCICPAPRYAMGDMHRGEERCRLTVCAGRPPGRSLRWSFRPSS